MSDLLETSQDLSNNLTLSALKKGITVIVLSRKSYNEAPVLDPSVFIYFFFHFLRRNIHDHSNSTTLL